MTDFLDAAPAFKTVKTRLGELNVTGLSIEGIAHLAKTHPAILELIQGGKMNVTGDFKAVIDLGLDVVSAVLAAGLGYPGNADAEKKCRGMTPEDVWNVGEAILSETFPSGPENFFQKLNSLPGLGLDPVNSQENPAGTA